MTYDDIKKLQKYQSFPSITILVPTHRTIPERLQDPIRVKDLLGQATEKLLESFEKNEILNLVRKMDELAERIDYTQTLDSLVFFVSKDLAQVYYLPFKVKEKVIIDKTFATKDLIYALNRSQYYWVLAISEKPTRLFKAINNYLEEIISPVELQQNMQGFPFKLNYDVTNDSKLLAVETGYLDAKYLTEQQKHFMHQVDSLLDKYVNQSRWPIIIMGTEKNRSYFKESSKHKDLIIAQVEGDFSKAQASKIGEITQDLIKDYLKLQANNILNLFQEAIGQLKFGSGIKDIWHKALAGRVRILIVERDYRVYGSINRDNPEYIVLYSETTNLPDEVDLVDELIEEVIKRQGKVVFVEPGLLKKHDHIGAILRY